MGSQKKGVSPVDCNLFQELSVSFMPSLVNGVSAVGEGEKGVSVVILTVQCAKTAKVCMVCFSLFVPFALFAVHAFQTECPL